MQDFVTVFLLASVLTGAINALIIMAWKRSNLAFLNQYASLRLFLSAIIAICSLRWLLTDVTQFWIGGHDVLPCLGLYFLFVALQGIIVAIAMRYLHSPEEVT